MITLARALAARIAGRSGPSAREIEALQAEVAQLRDEVEGLHGRLADVDDIQNRLDFAERLLAQIKSKAALPGGT